MMIGCPKKVIEKLSCPFLSGCRYHLGLITLTYLVASLRRILVSGTNNRMKKLCRPMWSLCQMSQSKIDLFDGVWVFHSKDRLFPQNFCRMTSRKIPRTYESNRTCLNLYELINSWSKLRHYQIGECQNFPSFIEKVLKNRPISSKLSRFYRLFWTKSSFLP